MQLTLVQDLAIQAQMALAVGTKTFDRTFAGVRFAETDGPLLYVYAKDEEAAAEIEGHYALHIARIATGILKQEVEFVVILPKVLQ
jgi:hypothetical protein